MPVMTRLLCAALALLCNAAAFANLWLPAPLDLPNAASVINHYDTLARLDYTALLNPYGHVLDGYSYTHDPLGLRTNIVRDFGFTSNSLAIGYDAIGQLTSWSASEPNGSLRQNEQLAWAYDAAHNLQFRTNGGLAQTFVVDGANELTNITRSGTLTFSGNTPAPATNITVNGLLADRYGDDTFARTNLSLVNGNNPFTNVAQRVGASVSNYSVFNLPSAISLQFDQNGNLTNDGIRSFSYDPENQLTNIFLAGAWKTEWVFDGFGRRRIQRDYAWSGSGWTKTNETHLVCDGRLPIQERNETNGITKTYTRGLDFSGSLAGAGGIGGLLALTDGTGVSYFYHADGAGNVTALMNGSGDITARYLYNPFGKTIAQWGPMADVNRYRAFSKEVHPASGIYHFGYRDYNPDPQTWTSRDPLGERGGINLHGFVGNSPPNVIDPFGLAGNPVSSTLPGLSGFANSDSYGPGGSFYGPGYNYAPPSSRPYVAPPPNPYPTSPAPGPEMNWNPYSGSWYTDAAFWDALRLQKKFELFSILSPR